MLAVGFSPIGATVNVTVGAASANVALTKAGANSTTLRLANIGSVVSFVEFGTSSGVAATLAASMPIPINSVVYVEVGPSITHMAAIGSGAGSVLYATAGLGGVYG
jgi:hypothetical protein